MSRNKTIDYVEFHATDLVAIKQFYSQVFGWEFEDYGPDYTSFKDGRIAGGFSPGPVSPGGPLVVIYVDDLAVCGETDQRCGGKNYPGDLLFPGGSRFHFTIQVGRTGRMERKLKA